MGGGERAGERTKQTQGITMIVPSVEAFFREHSLYYSSRGVSEDTVYSPPKKYHSEEASGVRNSGEGCIRQRNGEKGNGERCERVSPLYRKRSNLSGMSLSPVLNAKKERKKERRGRCFLRNRRKLGKLLLHSRDTTGPNGGMEETFGWKRRE